MASSRPNTPRPMAIEVPIIFYYWPIQRLHVGYRGRDSALVWMERDESQSSDDDGDDKRRKKKDDFGFIFTIDGEDPHWEGPREAEIYWLPHFCPSWHEAKDASAKRSMQRETLTNAFRYLSERDPAAVGGLEQELDPRGFSRWNKWFMSAKKWKRNKLRQVKPQVESAVAGGLSEKRARDQADYNDMDQGYESDDGDIPPPTGPRNMAPPARPSTGRKRQAPGAPGNGNYRGAKRLNPKRHGTKQHSFNGVMSGVRGSSHGSTSTSRVGSPNGDHDDDSDHGDDFSDIFDTRAPEGRSPSGINGHHPTRITPPPSGPRNLNNLHIPPFRNLVNGGGNVNGSEESPGDHRVRGRYERAISYNGEHLSEDDAVQEALRASRQPEDGLTEADGVNRARREGIQPEGGQRFDGVNGDGLSDEEALQRALSASQQPEAGLDRVVPSIERDEDVMSEH